MAGPVRLIETAKCPQYWRVTPLSPRAASDRTDDFADAGQFEQLLQELSLLV